MMPFSVLGIWFRGLSAVALFGLGIYLLSTWREHQVAVTVETIALPPDAANGGAPDQLARATPVETGTQVVRPRLGLNAETARLGIGLLLVAWSIGGGLVFNRRLFRSVGVNEPRAIAGESRTLRLPDGSVLQLRLFGPVEGAPVVLTHGWGLTGDEWCYAVEAWSAQHRVITWDLPGLGDSARPTNREWSLERLARNLHEVIGAAEGREVTLVGHSIGVMIMLTYCRLFPESLGGSVRKLVLAQSTYTNPVRTTARAALYTALEKPVLRPLCRLMIWLSPVVRVLNWMSYLNGSAHRSTERDSFSGKETRGQLDFITRRYSQSPPDVVGHGMLAMLDYDATATLSRIGVPTLVIAGENDRTCLPEASRAMADTIPGARLVMIPEARHMGLFEKHEVFNGAVGKFLREGAAAAAGPHYTGSPVRPPAT
jgi:pimeloyl-ACP methyl ester carboxylesterase